MALKFRLSKQLLAVAPLRPAVVACRFVPIEVALIHAAAPDEPEPEPLSVTRWTEKTELFAEYPPLVVGHLAVRDSPDAPRYFKALTEGARRGPARWRSRPSEVFRVDAPSAPASSAWT